MNIISWSFAAAVFTVGLLNVFWGNDPGFGGFLCLLSFVYFPPAITILKEKTGVSIPGIVKIGLGLVIIWATLGVGELFDKVDLMMKDL